MNMFHYITSPHLKVKVLNKALSSLSTNGILYMYWNWLAATREKIDFFGNYEGEKDFGILRGMCNIYFMMLNFISRNEIILTIYYV